MSVQCWLNSPKQNFGRKLLKLKRAAMSRMATFGREQTEQQQRARWPVGNPSTWPQKDRERWLYKAAFEPQKKILQNHYMELYFTWLEVCIDLAMETETETETEMETKTDWQVYG